MSDDPLWPRALDWLSRGSRSEGARLGVVGVPLSRTSISASSAHTNPAAVRAALGRFSTYSAELEVDLETLEVIDHGDLDVSRLLGEEAIDQVVAGIAALPSHDLVILLGGDNAITRPAARGLAADLSRVGLLTLDAHHDVRGFHDGATNGTPVRGLIEDGLAAANVTQIGIGDFTNSRAYRAWCEGRGITLVNAIDARDEGVGGCVRRHLDLLAATCDWIYVDLDVDVLDSAYAPGCPGARPGGLAPFELHAAAREAGLHPLVRAIDIVEVDAGRDPHGVTVDNAALCLLSAAAGLARRAGQ